MCVVGGAVVCSDAVTGLLWRAVVQLDLEQPFNESSMDDVFFTLAEEIDEITAPFPVATDDPLQ